MAREIGAVAPILSGAEEEDLDTGMAAFAVQGEQVGLVEGGRVHALRRLDMAHRLQPVAQPGGGLEVHGVGRLGHLGLDVFLHHLAFAVEEVFGFLHQLVIAGQVDAVHAGRAATLDLEQQAGPGAAFEHRIRTGAQQEGALQGVEGAVDRAGGGEWTEIDALGGLGAAMLEQLRIGMILAQQDIGETLVVAVADIVAGLQPLDQVGFQQQRFDLAGGGDEHHLGGLGHHAGQPVAMHPAGGVGRHPLLQALGLADIQDVARRIQHPVNAGRVGQGLEIGGDAVGALQGRFGGTHAPIY